MRYQKSTTYCFHTTLPSSAHGNGLAQTPTQAEMTRGTTVQILFSRLQNALKAACDESGEQHRSSDVLIHGTGSATVTFPSA